MIILLKCALIIIKASQVALVVKDLPVNAGDVRDVGSLGWEDPLQEGMATHGQTPVFLPGESPWTEEPGRHGVAKSQSRQR